MASESLNFLHLIYYINSEDIIQARRADSPGWSISAERFE